MMPSNSQQEKTVAKGIRKRGSIYYIDYYDNDGKRIRERIGKSKKIAELALKDREVKVAKNRAGVIRKDAPLYSFLEQYIEYSKTHHKPRTTERYKEIVNHFKGFLKKNHPHITSLLKLKPIIFEQYKTTRLKNIAARTVNHEIGTIKTILNQAIKWDMLNINPAKRIEKVKELTAKAPRFLTDKELKAFFEVCPVKHLPMMKTFYYTGMRREELRCLEWSDIDFIRKVIKVRGKEGFTPKSTEREIPIHKEVMKILKSLPKDYNLIFSKKGERLGKNRFRDVFLQIAKKAEIENVTLHHMRHTFASHLVMKGVDLATVKELLGHADIQTTMIYAHLAKAHLTQAVERL